jgi:hypothetical protein
VRNGVFPALPLSYSRLRNITNENTKVVATGFSPVFRSPFDKPRSSAQRSSRIRRFAGTRPTIGQGLERGLFLRVLELYETTVQPAGFAPASGAWKAITVRSSAPLQRSSRIRRFAGTRRRSEARDEQRKGCKHPNPDLLLIYGCLDSPGAREAAGEERNKTHWRAKSAITAGAAASKPTTSSVPASFGSAMVNSVAVRPTTTSLAAMPVCSR